jgi:hypothetical protein
VEAVAVAAEGAPAVAAVGEVEAALVAEEVEEETAVAQVAPATAAVATVKEELVSTLAFLS